MKARGGGAGVRAVVGLGLALGLMAGPLGPAAAAEPQRPGPGRGYYSVPAPDRGGERHWRHDGWRQDRGWGHDRDWGHDRRGREWHGRPWPSRPHYGGAWGPGPWYGPGQWVWNGWGWVWMPGY